jgi:hypothetical protein
MLGRGYGMLRLVLHLCQPIHGSRLAFYDGSRPAKSWAIPDSDRARGHRCLNRIRPARNEIVEVASRLGATSESPMENLAQFIEQTKMTRKSNAIMTGARDPGERRSRRLSQPRPLPVEVHFILAHPLGGTA